MNESDKWPHWPQVGPSTLRRVTDCLNSGRWTPRGIVTEGQARTVTAARRFAAFCDSEFGVMTNSGSSALVVGLESLDVGPGDEVIVPAYTWIATGLAVLRVGATPVLVDSDETGCIDPNLVQEAITPATRAVIAVHLHCSVADLLRLREICDHSGVALLEDASQAHGARFGDRSVGSWGDVSAFSCNQEKLVPVGEGGVAITNSPDLADRLERLTLDGSRHRSNVARGEYEYEDVPNLIGANYCQSEFQGALLADQLELFPSFAASRAAGWQVIEEAVASIDGVHLQPTSAGTTTRVAFKGALLFESAGVASSMRTVLSERTGFPFEESECTPMHMSPLWNVTSKRRFSHIRPRISGPLSVCEDLYSRTVVFHHRALLASPSLLGRVVDALGRGV